LEELLGLLQKAATISQEGAHNLDHEETRSRLISGATYRRLATAWLTPAIGPVHVRVVNCWFGVMNPMNQALYRIFLEGMEVADAYNNGINLILSNPDLRPTPDGSKGLRFILTVETDNMPPPDGLITLIGDMHRIPKDHPAAIPTETDEQENCPFAAIGGLYFCKGEGGMPMIYGDPKGKTFEPMLIPPEPGIVECRGVAMGFTLWDARIFLDNRLRLPSGGFFQTLTEFKEFKGARAGTQDLEFCGRALEYGYRFAVDTRVRVGHFDAENLRTW
jgi:hypothetical protein